MNYVPITNQNSYTILIAGLKHDVFSIQYEGWSIWHGSFSSGKTNHQSEKKIAYSIYIIIHLPCHTIKCCFFLYFFPGLQFLGTQNHKKNRQVRRRGEMDPVAVERSNGSRGRWSEIKGWRSKPSQEEDKLLKVGLLILEILRHN